MSKKIKNLPKFENFEKSGETDSYPPPEYLVKPAPGDTGFYMFKKAFDNQKKFFEPRIASSNHDLEKNDDQISA
jgi:hypothetical protein